MNDIILIFVCTPNQTQGQRKKCSQPGDSAWLLQYSTRVCVGVFDLKYALATLRSIMLGLFILMETEDSNLKLPYRALQITTILTSSAAPIGCSSLRIIFTS